MSGHISYLRCPKTNKIYFQKGFMVWISSIKMLKRLLQQIKNFLRNDGKYLYLDFMSVGKVLPGNEMKPDICLQQIPRACLRLELG